MTRVTAVVLAAGRAARYRAAGGTAPTKLVHPFAGEPLVRHPVRAALEAGLAPVLVVTGHAAAEVAAALDGLPVRLVHNPRFADGLASSLRAGLLALPPEVEGVLVLLGDMPCVGAGLLAELAAAAAPDRDAVVPVGPDGVRGNPVLLARSLFAAAVRLEGDEGARRLLRDPALRVAEHPVAGPAARIDLDEPAAFAQEA